jgi:hypothetical protein
MRYSLQGVRHRLDRLAAAQIHRGLHPEDLVRILQEGRRRAAGGESPYAGLTMEQRQERAIEVRRRLSQIREQMREALAWR